jgi:hypothetical protein
MLKKTVEYTVYGLIECVLDNFVEDGVYVHVTG